MAGDVELARLLEHPAIWRGRSATRAPTLPTGFAALDDSLPGKGWPRTGLIEILVSRFGIGELELLMPGLALLSLKPEARWWVWMMPSPLVPFAPALLESGAALERVLVIRAPAAAAAAWAFEQSLRSGACDAVMGWLTDLRARDIRRLQLAAERGRTLGILFRSRRAAREPSPAALRLIVEPSKAVGGVRVSLLKSRGGIPGPIEIELGCKRTES
jgi:hypothetical protein